MPPKGEPNTTDKLTMFGPRHEMAPRKGLVELLGRHPAVLVDDASPCPPKPASDILANAKNSSIRPG
jgi:hypothetical protein